MVFGVARGPVSSAISAFLAPSALAVLAALSCGCSVTADGDRCAPGDDCGDGSVCTDVAECASTESAPPWRISWTINGDAVSIDRPGDCDAIDELALTILAVDDAVTYRPITCAIGRFEFTALPGRFDTAVLEVFAGSNTVQQVSGPRDGGELAFDLEVER